MNNDEAARELAKVFRKAMSEIIDDLIEQKCYLFILEILKNIRKEKN
jgi:hypothetical protein